MTEIVSHRGLVVEKLDNGTAVVDINREHACAGCHEKGSCTMQSQNSVRIRFKNAFDLNVGDMVLVTIRPKEFFRSVSLIYVLPLVIMLLTAVVSDLSGVPQHVTAVLTLLSVALYFICLKFLHKGRDRQGYIKIRD